MTEHGRALLARLRDGKLRTDRGVSLLGLRAAAMLHYVTDLALLLRSKSGGRSLREEPALPRLLESRVVLEKLRPLEQRMRYQLDKLLRAAAAGAPGGTPNPSFFTPKSPRPILPQNSPISPQNATFLTQNGPILPQNTHFCPKMVPFLPQNAPFCPKMALFCLKMPYSPSAWHLFAPKRELLAPKWPHSAPKRHLFAPKCLFLPQMAPFCPKMVPFHPKMPNSAPECFYSAPNGPILPQNGPNSAPKCPVLTPNPPFSSQICHIYHQILHFPPKTHILIPKPPF